MMFEPREWNFTMKTQVGGVAGMGETATISDITWPKNEFYENEYANIAISCDNSACEHNVESYHFEIVMHRNILSTDGGPCDLTQTLSSHS